MNSMTEAGFERTIVNRRVFLGGLVAGAAGLLIPERKFWALDSTMLGRGDDLIRFFTESLDTRYPEAMARSGYGEVISRRGVPGAVFWFGPIPGDIHFDSTEKALYVMTESGWEVV